VVRGLSVDVSFASCGTRDVEYCHRSPVHSISESFSLLLTHSTQSLAFIHSHCAVRLRRWLRHPHRRLVLLRDRRPE
jgi:hypothetical protein